MAHYLVIFGIFFLIAAAMRATLVFINMSWFHQGFAGDSSGHYTIIKQLKKDHRSKYVEQYVLRNEMSYGLLFHRYCLLFPLEFLKKYSYVPNLLLFGLFTGIFFSYLSYFEREIFKYPPNTLLLPASIFYFISSSNLVFHQNEIAYLKLSERMLARASAALFYLGTVNHLIYHDNVSLLMAIFMGGITLITSSFSRQILFFTVPLLSLCFLTFTPVLILAGSFAVGFILDGTYFLKSVRHTVLYWHIYNKYLKPFNLMNMTIWVRVWWVYGSIKERKWKTALLYLMIGEPTRLLFSFPEFFFLLLFLPLLSLKVIIPMAIIMLIYVLTSFEKFRHLGESYRYLEYGFYYFIPFCMSYILYKDFNNASKDYWIIAYIGITLVVYGLIIYAKKPSYSKRDYLKEILDTMNLTSESVIFPIDKTFAVDVTARCEAKVFWWQPGGITSPKEFEEYFEEYPFFKKNWDHLFNKHKVTHVVCKKEMLAVPKWKYDFSELELISENDVFIAYKVNRHYL